MSKQKINKINSHVFKKLASDCRDLDSQRLDMELSKLAAEANVSKLFIH